MRKHSKEEKKKIETYNRHLANNRPDIIWWNALILSSFWPFLDVWIKEKKRNIKIIKIWEEECLYHFLFDDDDSFLVGSIFYLWLFIGWFWLYTYKYTHTQAQTIIICKTFILRQLFSLRSLSFFLFFLRMTQFELMNIVEHKNIFFVFFFFLPFCHEQKFVALHKTQLNGEIRFHM